MNIISKICFWSRNYRSIYQNQSKSSYKHMHTLINICDGNNALNLNYFLFLRIIYYNKWKECVISGAVVEITIWLKLLVMILYEWNYIMRISKFGFISAQTNKTNKFIIINVNYYKVMIYQNFAMKLHFAEMVQSSSSHDSCKISLEIRKVWRMKVLCFWHFLSDNQIEWRKMASNSMIPLGLVADSYGHFYILCKDWYRERFDEQIFTFINFSRKNSTVQNWARNELQITKKNVFKKLPIPILCLINGIKWRL